MDWLEVDSRACVLKLPFWAHRSSLCWGVADGDENNYLYFKDKETESQKLANLSKVTQEGEVGWDKCPGSLLLCKWLEEKGGGDYSSE